VPRRPPIDAFRGSLDLLVLKTLSLEPTHGWGISERVRQFSNGEFEMNQGSLYPALQRLERRGWVTAEWGTSENNRRARYYRLTKVGKKQLLEETSKWERLNAAIARIMKPAGEEG
jgi:PadR family transcriptional regulator, regulatory protein PadR